MNLVIDIGNTQIKAGVFKDSTLMTYFSSLASEFISKLKALQKSYPDINSALYSASGKAEPGVLRFLDSNYKLYQLTHETPVLFKNLYDTPKTLGLDRIALVSAAHNLYPNQNVLIIDAGTCITIDFINQDSEYLGGNISPGIQMRFKALHQQTANLPFVELQEPKSLFLGKSTTDAILNGVINGVVFEIDEYISRYKSEYMDLTVILTGGNQQYLSTKLKSSIFADSTFQLKGLSAILENILND
jgi:type III pantothenate kinase